MTVEENLELMTTLDDAWNSQDWDTFNKRHSEDTALFIGQDNQSQREGEKHTEKKL